MHNYNNPHVHYVTDRFVGEAASKPILLALPFTIIKHDVVFWGVNQLDCRKLAQLGTLISICYTIYTSDAQSRTFEHEFQRCVYFEKFDGTDSLSHLMLVAEYSKTPLRLFKWYEVKDLIPASRVGGKAIQFTL